MPIFLKHLVVQKQNEKSNERAFESMCVLALSQGDTSVLVSGLVFKSKHCRTYLHEREAVCAFYEDTYKLEASTSTLQLWEWLRGVREK